MQPQRPLLVPHCSPRAELGLPAPRRSRERSCNRWLLPAARCLSHAAAHDPSRPHTRPCCQAAVAPSPAGSAARVPRHLPCGCWLPHPDPAGGSRIALEGTPHLWQPPAPPLHLSQRLSPSSLAHSRHTPRINHPPFAQPGARKLPHLARIPPFSLEGPWSISLQEEFLRSPHAPGPGPRSVSNSNALTTSHTTPSPETLLPASPQHQPCSASNTTSACTLTIPLLPTSPISTAPLPPTRAPGSSMSHPKSYSCQGTRLCLCPTGPSPPNPNPNPWALPFSASSNASRTDFLSRVSLRCTAQ